MTALNERQQTVLHSLATLLGAEERDAIDDTALAREVAMNVEDLRQQLSDLADEDYVTLRRTGPVQYTVRLTEQGQDAV